MRRFFLLLMLAGAVSCSSNRETAVATTAPSTFCNPLDLSYRFMIDKDTSRREAADPTMVLHKGVYYLFASKTGGYWYSEDLRSWTLVETDQIPTEEYAPTAISMRDTVFFTASVRNQPNRVFKSADPRTGEWEETKSDITVGAWDPCFFQDDDDRLYLYWGCSNTLPIYGAEIDPYKFEFIGETHEVYQSDSKNLGWEISSDYNTDKELTPWIEGAWMNKRDGKYYLQYAGPDARFKCYSDAVVVGDSPLGEFKMAPHNAFAYKPEGYACGAGHGSTFEDKYGNMWHVGTVSISVKHTMERRLSLYPTFFDADGNLYINARFGDFPIHVPSKKIASAAETETGWMLLSYDKPTEVSSELEGYPAENMTNEEIRTYWSAKSGNEGEWAMIDLESECDVYAMQINFAEQDSEVRGRQDGIKHRYVVESSKDKKEWHMVDDQSASESDNSHNYIELTEKLSARYIRVRNIEVPSGKFAISGLRVFGKAEGDAPQEVTNFAAKRDESDRRDVTLTWDKSEGAIGYNISYGVSESMMYHNYMVYDATSVTIRSLSTYQPYYYTIEPFNESGVGARSKCVETK